MMPADVVNGFLDLHDREQIGCRLARIPGPSEVMSALVELQCNECGSVITFSMAVSAFLPVTEHGIGKYSPTHCLEAM